MSDVRRNMAIGLGTLAVATAAGVSLWLAWQGGAAPKESAPNPAIVQPGDRSTPPAPAPDTDTWPFDDPNYEERDDPEQTWVSVAAAVQQAELGTFVRCQVPPGMPSLYPHNHLEVLSFKRTPGALNFVMRGDLRGTWFNGPTGRAIAKATWNEDGSNCVIEATPEQVISGTLDFPRGFDPANHELLVCGALVDVGPDGFFEITNPVPERIRNDGTQTVLSCGINLDGIELDEVQLGDLDVSVYVEPNLAGGDLPTSGEAPWDLEEPLPDDLAVLEALNERQELLDDASKRWVEENLKVERMLEYRIDNIPEGGFPPGFDPADLPLLGEGPPSDTPSDLRAIPEE